MRMRTLWAKWSVSPENDNHYGNWSLGNFWDLNTLDVWSVIVSPNPFNSRNVLRSEETHHAGRRPDVARLADDSHRGTFGCRSVDAVRLLVAALLHDGRWHRGSAVQRGRCTPLRGRPVTGLICESINGWGLFLCVWWNSMRKTVPDSLWQKLMKSHIPWTRAKYPEFDLLIRMEH